MSITGTHRQKIFIRFLLSYIIILLIPIIMGVVSYHQTAQLVEQSSHQANLSILEQVKDITDLRLVELGNIASEMSLKNTIKRMSNVKLPLNDPDYFTIRETWLDLPKHAITNNFIVTYFIYFKNSDSILCPDTAYMDLEFFYNYFHRYDNYSYDIWHKEVLNQYYFKTCLTSIPMTFKGKNWHVLPFIHSFSHESFNGNIILFINAHEINKLLKQLTTDGGFAYIMNSDGQILTSLTDERNDNTTIIMPGDHKKGFTVDVVNQERSIISYTTSDYNGWTYVSVLPSKVVLDKVQYIKRITLIVTGISLILGMLIAYLLAYKNVKPITELLRTIKGFFGYDMYSGKDEFDILRGSVYQLIKDNNALVQSVQKQLPVIQASFFERLLKGEFNNQQEIEAALSHIGLSIYGNSHTVCILKVSGYTGLVNKEILGELNLKRLLIKEFITEVYQSRCYTHDIEDDMIALLISLDTENHEVVKKEIDELILHIKQKGCSHFGFKVTFFVGNIGSTFMEIGRSYHEARLATGYKLLNENETTIWFINIPKDNTIYYYPVDLQIRLANTVKVGDEEKVRGILYEIYRENFILRELPVDMLRQLLYEMRGTIFKLVDEIGISQKNNMLSSMAHDSLWQIDNFDSIDEIYTLIVNAYTSICSFLHNAKKSHNHKLIEDILDYLREAFMDTNLCLAGLAAHFDVTEVYLSQFFKEQTGENFSNYLESLRLKEAQRYLTGSSHSIEEIAKMVGYNSSNTFRRAYKRFHGLSPSEHRDNQREKTKSS